MIETGSTRDERRIVLSVRSSALACVLALCAATVHAQQPDPFRPRPSDTSDSEVPSSEAPLSGSVDQRLRSLDSVTYRLARAAASQVKTGKAGLFGFAGHSHVIQARAFHGSVVYYPPPRSLESPDHPVPPTASRCSPRRTRPRSAR